MKLGLKGVYGGFSRFVRYFPARLLYGVLDRRTRKSQAAILRVFYQHPKWFISLQTIEEFEEFVNHSPAARDLRILRVFCQNPNNLEEERFFHEFTGTINHN